MKNVKVLLLVLSVALNAAFVAAWSAQSLFARSGAAGCPLYRELGVTPDQWRKIEPRLREFQARSCEQCRCIDRTKDELLDLVAAAEPDAGAIGAKQKEILAGHEKMQAQFVDHLMAEKKVLTPEQQKRLFDMMRRRGCGCHGRGKGKGCGEGGDCPGCGRR